MSPVQRLSHVERSARSFEYRGTPIVLVITADLSFYSMLLSATSCNGLRVHWARSFERALEMSRSNSSAILVYDSTLPDIEWEWAVDILGDSAGYRVLLATSRIDEDCWRSALAHRAYDIVAKSAGSEELSRALRFAALSLTCEKQQ